MSESQARNGSLLRASVLMASGTMVSRVLGFIKAAMLLAALGSAGGAVSAAFQTANTLPNTIFNLLASGVFDAVLVPQIVRALKRDEGQVYINRLITLAGTILFLVAFISTLLAPVLIVIMAPGYSQDIPADFLLRPVQPLGRAAQCPRCLRSLHVGASAQQHHRHRGSGSFPHSVGCPRRFRNF